MLNLLVGTIERRRKALGMTQRQVATRAGISEQVYSQVKYGRNESPETVRSICLVLGLDPADVWQDISAEAAEARLDSATA